MRVAELISLPPDEQAGTFLGAVVQSNGCLSGHEICVALSYFELFVRNVETVEAILAGEAVLCRVGDDDRFQFERVGGSV